MDPHVLVDTASSTPMPAPWWFIQLFKTLGFTLHVVPMNLWFAGILVAMLLRRGGGEHAVAFSRRFMRQMPIIIAYGINFGIVPLLFIQVAYYQFFYPATILMAWYWMAIVGLLIFAYYGVYVYVYAFTLGGEPPTEPRWLGRVAGGGSAVLFIVIGFLLSNGMTLAEHADAWPGLWQDHQLAGAALGTALPALTLPATEVPVAPRWLMMFGLALGTTAAWVVVDAAWFADGASPAYRRWAARFALALAVVGAAWFAAAGSWYVFGTWTPELRRTMFAWPMLPLTVATAIAPGLPLVLLAAAARRGPTRAMAVLVAVAQIGVVAANAVSRQVVQNLRVGAFVDLARQPTDTQWGPLSIFLLSFVVGAAIVLWMVGRVVKATREGAGAMD